MTLNQESSLRDKRRKPAHIGAALLCGEAAKMKALVLLVVLANIYVCIGQKVHNGEEIRKEYDFIVVGAGSAGCPVANRLSEVPGWNVLLIEAGEDATKLTDIPYHAPTSQLSHQDWQYWADCGPHACLGMARNQSFWPRGKVMGGSSVLNYMQYVRGHAKDYDKWAEMLSDPEWSYERCLDFFKKSEDCRLKDSEIDPEYHGRNGYLTTERVETEPPLSSAFLSAAQEVGHKIRDINGKSQTGFARSQVTTRNGGRWHTGHAFIDPVVGRRNLHIVKGALARKVIIQKDKDGVKRAVGVEFEQNGKIYEVLATKEIVLSSGAIGSAQILLLSGVGPQDHLREVGIEPVHHSPGVGQNLQDHIAMVLTFLLDDKLGLSEKPSKVTSKSNYEEWLKTGKTFLSAGGGIDGTGFILTKYAKKSEDWPDIQSLAHLYSMNSFEERPARAPFGVSEESYDRIFLPVLGREAFAMLVTLLRPDSRGQITLASKDPRKHPKIIYNYYEDDRDVKIMVDGVKHFADFEKTKAFTKIGARVHDIGPATCDNEHKRQSDEWWECYVRHLTFTLYHPCCTAAMGKDGDEMAVLDSRMRVRGVDGLRVADASVWPLLVSGNTNAPSIMTGERVADFIKKEWSERDGEHWKNANAGHYH